MAEAWSLFASRWFAARFSYWHFMSFVLCCALICDEILERPSGGDCFSSKSFLVPVRFLASEVISEPGAHENLSHSLSLACHLHRSPHLHGTPSATAGTHLP